MFAIIATATGLTVAAIAAIKHFFQHKTPVVSQVPIAPGAASFNPPPQPGSAGAAAASLNSPNNPNNQDVSGPAPTAANVDPNQNQIQPSSPAQALGAANAPIGPGVVAQDVFRDPNTGLQTSANGPNANGGALSTSDPTLVQQAQNILGI